MAAVEIARYAPVKAGIVIDALQAEGIPAFPLPMRTGRGDEWVGILIDDSDRDAARRLILAAQADD